MAHCRVFLVRRSYTPIPRNRFSASRHCWSSFGLIPSEGSSGASRSIAGSPVKSSGPELEIGGSARSGGATRSGGSSRSGGTSRSEAGLSAPCEVVWKSAVHRSANRSNASSKFLQDYAGRRVRQTRTPNASAERVVANLIKLTCCRVKKTVSSSTPTCWRRTPSFRSRRNTISHRETQTQQENKTKKTKQDKERMCSLCRSVLYQVRWHCSSVH